MTTKSELRIRVGYKLMMMIKNDAERNYTTVCMWTLMILWNTI